MSLDSYIKLENKEAVIASLNALNMEIQAGVIKGMKASGKEIVKEVKNSFPVAQTIANMSRYDRTETIVSIPGNTPMVQTGELRDSVYSKIMPLMLNEPITLKISHAKHAFYGHMLEFGTSKMAARPWFYNGVAKAAPFLKESLSKMLSEVVARRNKLRTQYVRQKTMTSAQAYEAQMNDISKLKELAEQ